MIVVMIIISIVIIIRAAKISSKVGLVVVGSFAGVCRMTGLHRSSVPVQTQSFQAASV